MTPPNGQQRRVLVIAAVLCAVVFIVDLYVPFDVAVSAM